MKKKMYRWILILLFIFLTAGTIGAGIGTALIHFYMQNLPPLESLDNYADTSKWARPSMVLDRNGILLAEFKEEQRHIIRINQVPDTLINALVAVEDARFFEHSGFDVPGILRAFITNILAGKIRQGGSTITQQLAKNLFLTRERSYRRKMQELLLAWQIDHRYTKREILERYLNKIYFGYGAYGLQQAALKYFHKDLITGQGGPLSLGEAAMLAGLPKAPSAYSPALHPERAKKRLKIVLSRMIDQNFISKQKSKQAFEIFSKQLKSPKVINKTFLQSANGSDSAQLIYPHAGYYVDYIRQQLENMPSIGNKLLDRGGLKIKTGCDLRMQEQAERAVREGLKRVQGFIRPYNILTEKKLADTGPSAPKVQGLLVAIDPKTGAIRALVGGKGFSNKDFFNRATQTIRQPGSAFKPFIFVAALDRSVVTLSTIIHDAPVRFKTNQGDWEPINYEKHFFGPVTVRKILEHSINVASIKLMQKVSPEIVIDYARKFGITTPLKPFWSLALGTFEVSPIEITASYASFDNQGIYTKPYSVQWIKTLKGRYLKKNVPQRRTVVSPQIAYLMTTILKGVTESGTARTSVGKHLGRPAAGKTGTTDHASDAWFIGYTPELACAVWVGFDKPIYSLGRYMSGSRVAAPIWTDFMKSALKNTSPQDFPVPKGIEFKEIDANTGLLATQSCPRVIREAYLKGTVPTKYCPVEQESFLDEP